MQSFFHLNCLWEQKTWWEVIASHPIPRTDISLAKNLSAGPYLDEDVITHFLSVCQNTNHE